MATELIRMPIKQSLIQRFADRFEIEPTNVMSIVAATVFKQGSNEPPLTPDEVTAAMIVCNQYELNPFTKEIYAFRSKGKLLIIVSIDGWCALINRQKALDGIEFTEQFSAEHGRIDSITCKIHRNDRRLPIVVTEYFMENVRETDPWKKSPVRMLRHRALIQCARYAFSLSGIVDEDEAERIEGIALPNGPIIEGNSQLQGVVTVTEPTKITQDEARKFGQAWKKSGYAVQDAKDKLKELFNISSSLDIPSTGYAQAMAWAESAKVSGEVALSDEEKKAHEAFAAIGWNEKEGARFAEQYHHDWAKILSELNILIDKRNEQF